MRVVATRLRRALGFAAEGVPGPDATEPPIADPFEEAAVGMAFISLDSRFLRVNRALCDLLGRSREELEGMACADITHPEDQEYSDREIARLVAGDQPRVEFQKRYLRSDGGVIVGRVTSAVAVVDGQTVLFSQLNDVTVEAMAAATTVDEERRLEALTSCTTDVVFWFRLEPEYCYRYISDQMGAMSGYTPEQFYADPEFARHLFHADDVHIIDEVLSDPSGSGVRRLRWICADGSTKWIELRYSHLGGADGDTTDILAVARDITHQIEADRARSRRAEQQRAAAAFAHRCTSGPCLEGLYQDAAATMAPLVAADLVAVWWEIEAGGPFQLVAGTGFTVLEPGRSVVGAVESHPARVRATNAVTPAEPGDLEVESARSGIGVPILADGRAVGAVAVYSGRDHMADDDVSFLQAIATGLGAAADRVRYEEQLAYASLHDEVTGLPNRTMLIDHLSRTLLAGDERRISVVAVCGIDDFQLLNEALGPGSADALIARVATRLRSLAGNGILARISMDMFALVLPMDSSDPRASSVASEITAAMTEPFGLPEQELPVSMSVGVATGTSANTPNEVLGHALAALRQAESRGRGQWMHASGREQAAALRRLDVIRTLGSAVESGHVRARFQPIISLRESRIVGYEALARWERPDGTRMYPEDFIPIAEETGLIREIGLSILDQACAFLVEARATAGGTDLIVNVNVSARQLDDPTLPERMDTVLARHDLPRLAVCLELTESALVPGDQEMADRLSALKRLGLRLAIDDFGTGYSSFAYLTQFPIDLLKLDRAFVTDLQADPRRVAVARSIISLARSLGISVLAEGIETPTEHKVFAGLECELGQGFLWSRAVPPTEATSLLHRRLRVMQVPDDVSTVRSGDGNRTIDLSEPADVAATSEPSEPSPPSPPSQPAEPSRSAGAGAGADHSDIG